MVHKKELFQIKVHSNIVILLLNYNLINYFDIPNGTIELYYNNEELLDIKILSSYNINTNIFWKLKSWIQKLLRIRINEESKK